MFDRSLNCVSIFLLNSWTIDDFDFFKAPTLSIFYKYDLNGNNSTSLVSGCGEI